MSTAQFPLGWNEERVKRVIEHYESLTEEEHAAEDDAALAAQDDWDRQLEADYAGCRLDWLIDEARRDLKEGRCTDR